MIPLRLAELATAVGGRLVDVADPDIVVSGPVTADSREPAPGGLFVAIAGARSDGHDFVADAVAAGAVAALTTRPVGHPAVVVDDVVAALGRLASVVLERLPRVTVVAVTGSSGKTSTKDLIAQVAELAGPTVAPPGSYNTEVGLPLTVLRADEDTRVLVLEMGARGVGHIAYLCSIAPPHVAVVLNVGTAHVGEFGSVEAIATAKAELVEHVRPDGVVILGADDGRVAAMAAVSRVPVVRFGRGEGSDVLADGVRLVEGRPAFTLRTPEGAAEVTMRLVGGHQVDNALAAAAVGRALRLDVAPVADALSRAVPLSRWRMEVSDRADGLTVVNDAYNANPDSVLAALEALVGLAGGRRTWAVLGEMLELGDLHDEEHERVGRAAGVLGVDRLVVVGPGAAAVLDGFRLGGSAHQDGVLVADADAAVTLVHREVGSGDVVLVKASRSVGLERVAEALLAADGTTGGDDA